MKKTDVEFMHECPFMYSETYQLSEMTGGADDMCSINHKYCMRKDCPLQKEGKINVIWKGGDAQ